MSPSGDKMATQLGPIDGANTYLQKGSTAQMLVELQMVLTSTIIKVWH
jgi:hypothetical protein